MRENCKLVFVHCQQTNWERERERKSPRISRIRFIEHVYDFLKNSWLLTILRKWIHSRRSTRTCRHTLCRRACSLLNVIKSLFTPLFQIQWYVQYKGKENDAMVYIQMYSRLCSKLWIRLYSLSWPQIKCPLGMKTTIFQFYFSRLHLNAMHFLIMNTLIYQSRIIMKWS